MKEEVFIVNGRTKIKATIVVPDRLKDNKIFVIICTGWRSYRNKKTYVQIQSLCDGLGLRSITFDFRGHGDSSGNIEDFNLVKSLEDVGIVKDYLKEKFGRKIKFMIIAVSFSGEAALLSSVGDRNVNKLVIISGGFGKALTRGINNKSRSDYWNEIRDFVGCSLTQYMNNIAKLKIPITIIHGKNDKKVPVELSIELKKILMKANKKIILVKGADHKFKGLEEKRLKLIKESLDPN